MRRAYGRRHTGRRVVLLLILCAFVLIALLFFCRYATTEVSRNRFYSPARSVTGIDWADDYGALADTVQTSYLAAQDSAGRWAGYDFSQPVAACAPVEDDYFSDAAFLGDSLTDGLMLYSSLRAGEVLAVKGVTVYTIGTSLLLEDAQGEGMTILQALEQGGDYGKIYLLLGVNELSGDEGSFIRRYGELIDELHALYPDALIYVQSLLPVNEQVLTARKQPDYINNAAIVQRNAVIQNMCKEKHAFYLDLHQLFVSEQGDLAAEETYDGVHLYAKVYERWYQYLREHVPVAQDAARGRSALREGMPWLQ